ncbi:ATP:guanido phosphotransferase, catalytic domain protein [Opisthorchis viverrini]|uniref:ATP:guanido phosphotransferase, catalytic domain protein n=2 Tax=Opisthorchis viverrini TaxID=6198 RepID=A0A1S8WGA8_OPIVI|nr:ATP:guanido phosphotransferase, catalytic domain protein [Opisthorchis viverrini]
MFCPTEEELVNFVQCGDFGMTQTSPCRAKEVTETGDPTDKGFDSVGSTQTGMFVDRGHLLSFLDDPSHVIASLHQVGGYRNIPISGPRDLSVPRMTDSGKAVENRSTIPDVTSTYLFYGPQDQTVRETLHFTSGDRDMHRESFGHITRVTGHGASDIMRPNAPVDFSRKIGSSASSLVEPSGSSLVDANPAYSSTTHEIRWTQFEQETMASDRNIRSLLPMPIKTGLRERKSGECSIPRTTPSANTEQLCPTITSRAQGEHTLPTKANKVKGESCSDGGSMLYDHSLPVQTIEGRTINPSWNELSLLMNPSDTITHYLTIPSPFSSNSTFECDKEGHTSLLVQHSFTRHTSICPFTCTYTTDPNEAYPNRHFCSQCHALSSTQRLEKGKFTQTKMNHERCGLKQSHLDQFDPNGNDGVFGPFLNCVILVPPIGSYPPAVIVRWSPEHFHSDILKRAPAKLPVRRDRPYQSDLRVQPSGENVPIAPGVRMPSKSLIKSESTRKSQDDSLVCFSRVDKIGKKPKELYQMDVNSTQAIATHPNTSTELENNEGYLRTFRCIYVEVVMRRDLEGVARPDYLAQIEARTVHMMLLRKLKNAVATHILGCMSKRTDSEYTASESSELPPGMSELGDRGSTESSGIISQCCENNVFRKEPPEPGITVWPNNFSVRQRTTGLKSFLVRVGKMYKYLPTSTVSRKYSGSSGVYVFTSGLQHTKLPKPWWDHVRSVESPSDHRSAGAWKIHPLDLTVGGLINYEHHLQILVSSNDGRLGVVCCHADALVTELIGKGTRYVINRKSTAVESNPSGVSASGDSIRMFIKSPLLARLLASNGMDLAMAVGLEDLGLGVSVIPKESLVTHAFKWDTIVVYTKSAGGVLDHGIIKLLTMGIQRLRAISLDLAQSATKLRRQVMPVESVNYLYRKLHENSSKLLIGTGSFWPYFELHKELQSVSTTYHGTLGHCIRGNAYCSAEIHPRAPDPDAFEVFRTLFDPILSHFASVLNATCQPDSYYHVPKELNTKVNIPNVLRYRVRFVRNIAGFPFSPIMTVNEYETVERICKEALLAWKEEGSGNWYRLQDIEDQNPKLYHHLQRRHLLTPNQTAIRKACGNYRFWPQGRSVYIAPSKHPACDLVVQINHEDHLRVICVDWSGKHPYLAYSRATRLIAWLDGRLNFSRSPKWGYLSPLVSNVGTGMQLSAWLKLPRLEKNIALVERVCTRYRLRFGSTCPHGISSMNQIFDVAPISSLGRSESQIATGFIQSLRRICKVYGKHS